VGQLTDTNAHIINRAGITGLATTIIFLFGKFNFQSKLWLNIILYGISMLLVFLYFWITGFFEELHPNAYRDIFLNYTGIFVVVTFIISAKEWLKRKKD